MNISDPPENDFFTVNVMGFQDRKKAELFKNLIERYIFNLENPE